MSMAVAGSSTASGWPGRRVLIALLVISALLNLCFIAGAAWIRFNAPSRPNFEQHYRQLAAELDLDPQQRIGFDKYVAAMRSRNEKMRQQVGPLISAAWDEMAKPQADAAQILQLYDQAAEKRRELQREATVQTLDLMSILSPAQRTKFVAIARERRAAWLRR